MKGLKGFTLIEMLVSMAILAVVSGLVIANIRGGSRGDEVRQAAQIVAGEFRKAQTMTIAGKTVWRCRAGALAGRTCPSQLDGDCGAGGECRDEAPPGGFGIRVSAVSGQNQQIITFADADGDRRFDTGEEFRRQGVAASGHVIVQSAEPLDGQYLEVVFSPPAAQAWFNGAQGSVMAKVKVIHDSGGEVKTVQVNRISGQITSD